MSKTRAYAQLMTTRHKQVEWAVSLLGAGVRASDLPGRLRNEFGLSPSQAQQVSQAAILVYRQRKRRKEDRPK